MECLLISDTKSEIFPPNAQIRLQRPNFKDNKGHIDTKQSAARYNISIRNYSLNHHGIR